MYNSHDLAIRIKSIAKERKKVIKDMLAVCELGSNTMSGLYHGKSIAFDSLAKIADYLEVSVDYLLGRTDEPQTVSNSGSSISQKYIDGNATASITHSNKDITSNDKMTDEFIQLFQSLDIADKIAVMNLALEKSKK